MLRNSFLSRYKQKLLKGREIEDHFKQQKDYYDLYSNRPIGEKEIKRIPDRQLDSFVQDLMTNPKSTAILYSTNANKEIHRYLHSNEVMEKNSITQRGSSTSSYPENDYQSKKIRGYSFNFSQINKHIKQYKEKRMRKFNVLNQKNMIFYDDIKVKLLLKEEASLETVNSLRMTNYNRSLQRCKSIFSYKPHFKLPNVKLDIDNVFSRLHYNVVQLNHSQTESNWNKKKKLFSSQSFIQPKNKKMFTVKNVIKSANGKAFTTKITNQIFNKCFFKHSGGPLSSGGFIRNKDNFCNTHNEIDDNQDQPLLSLSTMKDNFCNSYLHDAVIDDSYEFVKFYLDKNLSPNEQNIKGNTPLHYAMMRNNLKIIKLLLEYKGDITIKNIDKETPYDLASIEARKLVR